MGCFSTRGICCTTDLGHLAHPPPSIDILWGCTGHGALIAPVFGTIPRNPFCASYGMGSCFQRRFLGTTIWCFAPGLEDCLLYSFDWRPAVLDDDAARQTGSLGRIYGSLFLAPWTLCFHRLLSLVLCAAAVASTRGGISAAGHCHALKMA